MAYTFDGANREIQLSPGTRSLDVKDLYSRWKDWVLLSDNSKWPIAFTAIGGDIIDSVSGTFVPIYAYLQNGWHIHAEMTNHTLNVVNGILLVDGGGDPFADVPGYTVRINYQQPVQAITVATGGSSGPTAADIWAYGIEQGLTAEGILRLLLAVQAGKTTITDLGGGNALVTFRDQADSKNRISADMAGSERTSVTIDPS